MCFNQKYSLSFALMGILTLCIIKKYPEKFNNLSHFPIIFYIIMELLQTIQYNYTNNCDNIINRLSTEFAFILVIVQPLMWNYIFLNEERKIPLDQTKKGMLYLAIILSLVWIIFYTLRRFSFYGIYKKIKKKF